MFLNVFRDAFEIFDKPDRLHRAQDPPGGIKFPPPKSLAHRCGVMVMVVVPPFAERDECQYKIVT